MIIAVRIITFIGFHLNREFHHLPHAPRAHRLVRPGEPFYSRLCWDLKRQQRTLKKSPLLLERVDRAQPGTGVEGTPDD